MLYEGIFAGIIVGLIARGRLTNLAHMKLSRVWLVFCAFFIQLGMEYLASKGIQAMYDYRFWLHGFSYLILFIFLWLNRHLPGSIIITLGFLLNFLVIMLNGGAMPVALNGLDPSYVTMLQNNELPTYIILDSSTRLPWLSDIFINPWPIGKAFSAGDVFACIGVFWLVYKSMVTPCNNTRLTSVRGLKM